MGNIKRKEKNEKGNGRTRTKDGNQLRWLTCTIDVRSNGSPWRAWRLQPQARWCARRPLMASDQMWGGCMWANEKWGASSIFFHLNDVKKRRGANHPAKCGAFSPEKTKFLRIRGAVASSRKRFQGQDISLLNERKVREYGWKYPIKRQKTVLDKVLK